MVTRVREFLSGRYLTLLLGVAFPLVYLLELFVIIKWNVETFQYWLVFTPGYIPTPGWILGLVVHQSVHHLAINMGVLLVYGSILEGYISRKWYLSIYLTSGLLAGLIHTNITQNTGAGASGAIFGLMGFYSIFYLADHRPDNWNSAWENVRYMLALGVPLVVVIQGIVDFFLNSGAANYAHVSGALIGGLLGVSYVSQKV